MIRIMSLLLALCLTLPTMAQTQSNEEANELFVEAVQLWNRAKSETGTSRLVTLLNVQANLEMIIVKHSSSTLAVRLVIGETIGPLSVEGVKRAASDAASERRIFSDCPECPEMVVVPAGQAFLVTGSAYAAYSVVTIAEPFAVGMFGLPRVPRTRS